jgi:hypothetical protein
MVSRRNSHLVDSIAQLAPGFQAPALSANFLPEPAKMGYIIVVKAKPAIPESAVYVWCLATKLDLLLSRKVYRGQVAGALLLINDIWPQSVVKELGIHSPATQSAIAAAM